MAAELRHPQRLHRRQPGIEPPRYQRLDLVHGASRHHGVEAGVDGGVQVIAARDQGNGGEAGGDGRACGLFALPIGQCPARRTDHRHRPFQALAVAGGKAYRGHRVEFRQFGLERLAAEPVIKIVRLFVEFVGNVGNFGQPFGEDLEIKPGAANHHRQPAVDPGGLDFPCRHLQPAPGRTTFRRRQHPEQPVRDRRFFRLAGAHRQHG